MITKFIAQIWTDIDPAEGESLWYDLVTGWETADRRTAIQWVRANGRALRHGWLLG